MRLNCSKRLKVSLSYMTAEYKIRNYVLSSSFRTLSEKRGKLQLILILINGQLVIGYYIINELKFFRKFLKIYALESRTSNKSIF